MCLSDCQREKTLEPSYGYERHERSIRSGRSVQEPFATDPQQYAPLLDLHETSGGSKQLGAISSVRRNSKRRPAHGQFLGSASKTGGRITTDEICRHRL